MEGYPGKGSLSEVSSPMEAPLLRQAACTLQLAAAARGRRSGRVPAPNSSCLPHSCVRLGPGGAHGGDAPRGVRRRPRGREWATVRAREYPGGGARGHEVLGRGAAVVPSRPADGASGGRRVVDPTEGGQVCAGGRIGAHGRSLWASPGCPRGPGGALRQVLGTARAKACQGRVGRAGPARGGLAVFMRAGPGRACQVLVGIGHFPYCKDC